MYLYSDQKINLALSPQQLEERLLRHIKSPHMPGEVDELIGQAHQGSFSFSRRTRMRRNVELELYGSYCEVNGELELTWNTRLSMGNKLVLFCALPIGLLLFGEPKYLVVWVIAVALNGFAYKEERARLYERLSQVIHQATSNHGVA